MSRVLAIQHTDCETIGTMEAVAVAKHIDVHRIRPFAGDPVPRDVSDYRGVIIMGGPMGVYESGRYPFLVAEMNLIRLAMQVGLPLLGICLGSQLIAAALGSNVRKGIGLEIGWHPVSLSKEASTDPLWRGIESPLVAFHWHGDVFDVPDGAVSLARSSKTECQAFRHGDTTYGILFHMEVTDGIVTEIVKAFPEDLRESGMTVDQIKSDEELHLSKLQGIGARVFSRWANLMAH